MRKEKAMVKKIIVSELAGIRAAVTETIGDAREHGLVSEEKTFDIKLSLNELLTNSVKYSGTGSAVLTYCFREGFFCCSIVDNGRGFESSELRCSELYEESGRGVFIVDCIADELRYNKKGNGVYLRIHLD